MPTTSFGATLRGHNELPLVIGEASASFKSTLKRGGNELSYELRWSNLESAPVKAHIHLGKPGTVGGDIVALGSVEGKDNFDNTVPKMHGLTGRISGVVSRNHVARVTFRFLGQDVYQGIDRQEWAKFVSALRNGYCYVNIHTETYTPPSGALRGQIR